MRIALLSDIHGNAVALDAVLTDLQSVAAVDGYWILGDLVAMGPDPVGVMNRLTALPNCQLIRGNTDRWLSDIHSQFPLTPEQISQAATANESEPLELAYAMVWAQGALTGSQHDAQIANLPLEYRTTLPDGARVLCVHAAPGADDGEGIRPVMNDAQIAHAIAGAEADLIFVGHTHWALDRTVNGVRVVNLGSISLQVLPDLRASYVILEATEDGYTLEFRKVDYDHGLVVEQLAAQKHPAQATVAAFLNGRRRPFWES
jgi:putative phosphoesterase